MGEFILYSRAFTDEDVLKYVQGKGLAAAP